jgi:hypothetical protein
VQIGLVARSSKATLTEGLLTGALRAGPFWPIATSLVGHYASAWLPPCFLQSAKIGSVTVVQTNAIPL